jgi:hypothetical protein
VGHRRRKGHGHCGRRYERRITDGGSLGFRTFQVCPKDLRAALRQVGGAGVMALGINGATSESARLTELFSAGGCYGFRELPRRLRC